MHKIIICIFSCFIGLVLNAQNPVDFLCANYDGNNDVVLTWEIPAVNCGSVNFQYTILTSENLNGPYTNVAIFADESITSHIDGSGVGNASSFYIIQSDCDGVLSYSDTLDLYPPETPVIDYITVVDDTVEINFFPSSSPETDAYIIYSVLYGNNNLLDTIYDPAATQYIDTEANANTTPEEYTIAATDACINTGQLNNEPHRTLYMTSLNDSCDNKVRLDWYPYQGWESQGTARQELYISKDGGPFELEATLDPDIVTYVYESFEAQNNICFRMHAVRNGDFQVSMGNITCNNLEIATIPTYIYPRKVSYDENNSVLIEYHIDNNAGFEVYIAKQSENDVTFINIETELVPDPLPEVISYFSDDINGSNFGQYFYISLRDSCGIEYIPTSIKAIKLETKPISGFQNQLKWNEPGLEFGTVTGYNIYRREFDNSWTYLASNPPGELNYFDFVGDVVPTANGDNCYRVEAEYVNDYPLIASENLSMFSNIDCAIQPAVVYAPNVFAPDGVNNVFKGVVINADVSNFVMLIMNKWGEVIFESNDPDLGWDGRIEGKTAPEGAYPYYFRFSNYNGIEKEKKGAVILLR